MSAPTPAPGDERPREGYYPDPSIPGYVRYWNGAAWVPGTSRPAPADGEPLSPPPGVRPATAPEPSSEETGPHYLDEEPVTDSGAAPEVPAASDPRVAGTHAPASGTAPASTSGAPDGAGDGQGQPAPAPQQEQAQQPASPQKAPADPAHTFVLRRPVTDGTSEAPQDADRSAPARPGPGGAQADEGTMTFRQVPRPARPQDAAQGQPSVPAQASPAATGTPDGAAGPPAQAPAAGPFPGVPAQNAGPGQGGVPGQTGPAPVPHASASPAPSLPQQAGAPHPAAPAPGTLPTSVTGGPGGGQAAWAQQVQQLAGTRTAAEDQPVVPWKPPVEDPFQAAARQQAAARPAGLGKRLLARLVDSAVVGAVTAAAAVPLGIQAADHIDDKIEAARQSGRTVTVWLLDGTTGTYLGIVLAVLLVFGALYEALPTAKWGRTLGKKLCGLEVRDIEAHEAPSLGQALRRWLVYSVPGILVVGVVGVVWCLFDRPWRQCWHDKAAHTFVAG